MVITRLRVVGNACNPFRPTRAARC